MTAPRRWPPNADHARMDSISLARHVKQQVLPLLEALENGKLITQLELSLRLNRISNDVNEIEVKLIQVGPQSFQE